MSYSNTICTNCHRCPGHRPSCLNGGEVCDDCVFKPAFHMLSSSQNPSNNDYLHDDDGAPNQHSLHSPPNTCSSNHNSMLPFCPFIENHVAPQPCHQINTPFDQTPIVSSNVQGINVNANNMNHHTPTTHRFQQPNSSNSNSITCANPSTNANSLCQNVP